MTRLRASLLSAGIGLVVGGGAALGQGTTTPAGAPERGRQGAQAPAARPGEMKQVKLEAVEPAKQLTSVDAYLMGSEAYLKLVFQASELAQLEPGRVDAALLREAATGLQDAIKKAEGHLQQGMIGRDVERVGGGRRGAEPPMGMQSSGIDATRLEEVKGHLRQARTEVERLVKVIPSRRVTATEVSRIHEAIGAVNLHLTMARRTLGEVSKSINLSRLDEIDLNERLPVRGVEEPMMPMEQPGHAPGQQPIERGTTPPSEPRRGY